ncbi:MAG: LamG-like jellyroll fold domain-containing protein [Candidatus Acidiferrum sp.]
MLYNQSSNAMQYCDSTNWIAMGATKNYIPYGIGTFGVGNTLNYISQTGGAILSVVADGKSLTASFWIQRDPGNLGTKQMIFQDGNNGVAQPRLNIMFNTSNKLQIQGWTSGNVKILDITAGTAITDGNWHHIAFSYDLTGTCTNGTSTGPGCFIYQDGVTQAITVTTFTNNTINYSAGGAGNIELISGIDNESGGGNLFLYLADIWINFNSFMDLSVAANRQKFLTADGKPVNLGGNGSGPTGSQPALFFSENSYLGDTDPTHWPNNLGSGGGFGYSGTPSLSGTNPGIAGKLGCLTLAQITTATPAGTGDNDGIWGDGTYIYATETSNFTTAAYTFNGTTLTLAGRTASTGGYNDHVWGDGKYIYVSSHTSGLRAYSFNGTTFTLKGTYAGTDPTEAWGDGTYIYLADGAGGLRALTFDGTTFTLKGTYNAVPCDVGIGVKGYNGYIFSVGACNSVSAFTFNGTSFTLVNTQATGDTALSLYSDGRYYYVGEHDGIQAFSFNGTTFTLKGTYATGTSDVQQITGGYGPYIYAGAYSGGPATLPVDALSFDGTSFTLEGQFTSSTNTFAGIWSDGKYLYAGQETTTPRLVALSLSNTCCANPSAYPGSIIYSYNSHVPQYCTRFGWVPTGPVCTDSGLAGWWKFDESSGSSASDSSGNGNTGTMVGGASWWVAGKFNNAITTNSGNSVMDRLTSSSLELAGSWSVSVWFKANSLPTSGNLMVPIVKAGPSGDNYQLVLDNGNISAGAGVLINFNSSGCCDNHFAKYTTAISTGVWYHLAGVYDSVAQTLTLYLNGSSVASASVAGFPPEGGPGAGHLTIGAENNSLNDAFDGLIDDAHIYSRALSAADVTALYNGALPTTSCGGCIGTAGATCPDGAVYAGTSPTTGKPMFTTHCDFGQTWNGTACTGSATLSSAPTSITDCTGLSAGGYSDWYLPDINELALLYTNHVAIGNFDTNTCCSNEDTYWSSTGCCSGSGYDNIAFQDGTQGNNSSGNPRPHRCVRSTSGGTCGNPPGREADLMYNNGSSTMQYCNGANWIGIGK